MRRVRIPSVINFNAGVLRDPGVKPDGITQRLADLLAQGLCHPPGGGDGGNPPGFQHDDPSLLRRHDIKERQRNPCCLAGTGRGLKYNGGMLTNGRCQFRENVVDGVGRQNLSALDILLHAGSIGRAAVHVNTIMDRARNSKEISATQHLIGESRGTFYFSTVQSSATF